KGWKQITKPNGSKPYVKDEFEALTKWAGCDYQPSLSQLLATATFVEDVPFASLYEVKKWKTANARPKDIKDIELIDKYLSDKSLNDPTITICSSANFYKQAVD